MSAGAEIWKNSLVEASPEIGRAEAAAIPSNVHVDERQIASLVRQVFLPSANFHRTRVLFASATEGTSLNTLAERVGQTLVSITGATVAIMVTSAASTYAKKPPTSTAHSAHSGSDHLGENLWRISTEFLPDMQASPSGHPVTRGSFPFDYVLMTADMSDPMLPEFCSVCEGAVLVITAQSTHKQSALRAKQMLRNCHAELLGTVLDGRQFPIPDTLYRRL